MENFTKKNGKLNYYFLLRKISCLFFNKNNLTIDGVSEEHKGYEKTETCDDKCVSKLSELPTLIG